jgi:hypothetical protein
MRIQNCVPGVFAALLMAVTPMAAHHAFAAEFDSTKPIKFHGTVTKFEWVNPHSWIYVDVKGEDGKVVNWMFELGAPGAMLRQGWKKDSVSIGTEVDIAGFRAKSGENVGNARSITLPGGRELFSAGSGPDSTTGSTGKQ